MMKPSPGNSSVDHSTRSKDPLKPGSLCDRFVSGKFSDLDNWIWIIEYFAKFKTELSMIHDVFEMTPNLPDYLGEHTNEMVAFRCLATLFDCSTSGIQVVSNAKAKIEFDSSESCEYVLQCILDEIPLSELKPGAPGLSKWNLLPFLKSKLTSLPTCALELLIESSSEKDIGVSPCKGQETPVIDSKETDQVTPRMADPNLTGSRKDGISFCRTPGDEADENSSSHALLERRDEEFQNMSDGHVSSPPEKIYRCNQCKESGELLFCSKDGCTVMVHEKCVASPPTYDNAGNFFCSLCASTEYSQSQDKVAKAKKKLLSFLSLLSKVNKMKPIKDSSL